MKKLIYLSIAFIGLLICPISIVNAQGTQGVSINPNNTPADPSAILDVSSSTKGTLLTRMTTTQRDAISNPAEGLQIFNSTTKCFEAYVNNAWYTISCPANCLPPAVPSQIYGNDSPLENASGENYYIDPVNGATVYTWIVPSGATLTSGQGTASIALDFTCAHGVMTVVANNACGSSPQQTFSVNTYPITPDAISGPTTYLGGLTAITYSISPIPNATSYAWTVPSGATIIGGQGTETITVDFGCSASGDITVVQTNPCGVSPAQTLFVSTDLEVPGTVSGPTVVTKNSTATYSISPIANATSYTWTVPSGATITGGLGTETITVDFGCSASGDITVVQNNSCGSSSPQTLSINSTDLEVPGTIFGPTVVPQNTNATYAISPVANAFSYTWTVPPGATMTAGQGTTSINVQFGCSVSGDITVVQNSATCTSLAQTLNVNTYLVTLDAINGPTIHLGGLTGVSYSIPAVPNSISYTWTVPFGATITGGQGTEAITVDFGCSAIGDITVVQHSATCTSLTQTRSVSTKLEEPGTISGPTFVTQNTVATYAISPVSNGISYTWTVPSGASITTGQGTTSITVDFLCSSSGDITVVQNTASCTSLPQKLSIVNDLQVPGTISGPTSVLKNATATYSINPVPNATSYTWTVSLGSITSGQGTTSINVTWGNSSGLGSVSVVQTIGCRTSSAQTITVGVNASIFAAVGTTSWTAPAGVTSVEVLVVAGGGGGGNNDAGGGGAGGLIYNTFYPVIPGNNYTVTVGVGGGGSTQVGDNGANGQNSVFGTLVAIGGGGGGAGNGGAPPGSGGSGGGQSRGIGSPGSGTPGQGYDGAQNPAGNVGGGGGGANSPGNGRNGGDGRQISISGINVYYAGGGGGGVEDGSPGGTGGLGGGGNGGTNNGIHAGQNGTDGLGGGGGGDCNGGNLAGNGGSGVVIVRY